MPTPEELMQAHQYLYYVKCFPVISDYEYDMFCQKHGLEGQGGSDHEDSYPQHIKDLAETL